MKRLLVTACGGDVGQAVIKALQLSQTPYLLQGCDTDKAGVGEAFVEQFHAVPKAADPDYLEKIDAICRAERIDAVIPACDAEIAVLATHRKLLSGAVVVCQDAAWEGVYGNKLKCMTALKDKVKIAPFADGRDEAAVAALIKKAGFPLIVKPGRSFGSRWVVKVCDFDQLGKALAQTDRPLVQKYLGSENEEYSAGAYGDGSGVRVLVFKRSLEKVGCSWYAETSTDPAVLSYCEEIARASALKGSANIQLRKTGEGPRLLEINARFSSLAAARAACGFNDVDWSVRAALGLGAPVVRSGYKKLRFRRFFQEMIDFGSGFKVVEDWSPVGRVKIKDTP